MSTPTPTDCGCLKPGCVPCHQELERIRSERTMTAPPDGGPAFPRPENSQKGMSLRDWYAGMALVGKAEVHGINYPEDIAKSCYDLADAMLASRGGG